MAPEHLERLRRLRPAGELGDRPTPDPNLGVWKFNQKTLQMPTSNTSLKAEADPGYSFVGRTDLTLSTGGITVTGKTKSGVTYTNQTIGYPSNGVIYIDNDTCTGTYKHADPRDLTRGGCGIARVKGTYNQSLTIAAADDILITGNIRLSTGAQAVLGLVSNNFIRLNHPIVEQAACGGRTVSDLTSLTNGPGTMMNPVIDAALLALKHSFIVDNWACGDKLDTLTVNGAIAQKFRGPVGTGSKTSGSGYLKNYQYDDRLRVRIPPSFIDPVQSAWGIQTYQEQALAK